jgi:uncharacterized protein YgiB involved in biofilm formation
MKRSAQITLVLLTSAAAASLSACDADTPAVQPDNGGTFTSLAECVAKYDQKTCEAAQKLAQNEHLTNAPHYKTRDDCIREYGPDMCTPASQYGSHDSFFVPMMIGYMMGSAGSQPAPLYYGPGAYRHYGQAGYSAPIYSSAPSYRNTGPIGSAPIYRPGTATTKGGLKSSTALTPVQRGGFGSSFKPTSTFKSSYSAANPDSFGRGGYSKTGGAMSAKSYSSYSSARSYSSSSSSSVSRGGFGSSGRSFGGGGFGG